MLETLQTLAPLPLEATALQVAIARGLGDDHAAAEPLTWLLVDIARRSASLGRFDDICLNQLWQVSASATDWNHRQQQAWSELAPLGRHLVRSPAVQSVARALDLAHEYTRLYESARRMAVARPTTLELSFVATERPVDVLRIDLDQAMDQSACSLSIDRIDPTLREPSTFRSADPSQTGPDTCDSATLLERFEGFVDQIEDGTAYVTLTSEAGETLDGEYPAAELEALGIRERRRFICTTLDRQGHVEVHLGPLPWRGRRASLGFHQAKRWSKVHSLPSA